MIHHEEMSDDEIRQIEWVGDDWIADQTGDALEAYLSGTSTEQEVSGDVDREPVDPQQKVTRSGRVYIAKISPLVLSASTKRISTKKAMSLHKEKSARFDVQGATDTKR